MPSRRLAPAPSNVELLSEGNGSVVVGDHAESVGVGRGEGNAVVDVEDAAGAARRVDVAGRRDLVRLGVDLTGRPDAAARDGGLGGGGRLSVLREVVSAEEGAGDTLLQEGVAVVSRLDDRELEAARVLRVVSLFCKTLHEDVLTFRFRCSWQFLVRSAIVVPGPM